MTRAITLISLLVIMLAANVGWQAIASQNAENLHTGIIGEPLPPHCIYYANGVAYDAPCQDYRIAIPLALHNPAWVFGPPPTPAPYAPIEAYSTPDPCWPPGANPCEG